MLRIQRALLSELGFVFVMLTFVITSSVFLGVSLQLMRDGGGALGGALLTTLLPKLLLVPAILLKKSSLVVQQLLLP